MSSAERAREWRRKHPGENARHVREWREKDPLAYRAAANEYERRRKAGIKEQTPKWADKEKISELYREASRIQLQTGIRMAVDHIIPLKGELVRGLHVRENLQIIRYDDNRRKRNQYHVA